jgi:pimeloyl-ACP methyl ester carboxylesterase
MMKTTSDEFRDAQAKLLEAYSAQTDSHFVDLSEPALRTHYLESGHGDAVLMIHGGNSFAASWAPLIQPLSRQFHLYLPDRPGCGLTDKVDYRGVPFRQHSVAFVRNLLDRIGIERATLVGNSMGGYFAFAFALAHPERVVKIAVIGATPLINNAMPIPHRMLSVPGLNRFIWSRVSARATPPRALYAHPEKLRPEVLSCARVGGRLPGAVKSWLTMVEELGTLAGFRARYNLKGEMKNIRVPSLFIQGDKDGYGTVASVQRVQKGMPRSQLEVVPNAGHVPWYDETEHCLRSLQHFLRK